ncbi:MAG: hypothetical protein HOW97_30495 [Catenulispora sp.]|nr:hypothetical protein [Catenulispora sp.]
MTKPRPNIRRLTALLCALITGLLGFTGAANATTAPLTTAAPSIGLAWFPTPNGSQGQCGGSGSTQWTAAPNWTNPILIDTDNRDGGCIMSLGVFDPGNAVPGLSIQYTWEYTGGSYPDQCQNLNTGYTQGTFSAPVGPTENFGPAFLDDTDNRSGYCNLTFTVSGRTDVALDIQFYPTPMAEAGQCRNVTSPGAYFSASTGSPVTIGLDTDGRGGGCELQLRLEHIGF